MIKTIKSIKLLNQPFIIIPKPLKDEIFSSWFTRLSYAHHLHPHTFINLYFGVKNRGKFKKNIDTSLNKDMLSLIQTMCNNKVQPFKLTLKIHSGYLQEDAITVASNRFLGPLKFCPLCLQKDKIPYFRKYWKLVFYNACKEHQCYLYDTCPQCKNPLSILKMYNNNFPFNYCSTCGFELKKAKKQTIKQQFIVGLYQQNRLYNILTKGYVKFGKDIVYSFCFFDVITQLTKIIMLQKNILFIQYHPLFNFLENPLYTKINSAKSVYLQLNIIQNYALFGIILSLFDKYQNNLQQYINANHKTHWDMVKEIRYLSYWYNTCINNIVPRYIAFGDLITKEEIKNGVKYLKSQHKEITKANLSRLFGNISHFAKIKISE